MAKHVSRRQVRSSGVRQGARDALQGAQEEDAESVASRAGDLWHQHRQCGIIVRRRIQKTFST